jgi:hypothetical protein
MNCSTAPIEEYDANVNELEGRHHALERGVPVSVFLKEASKFHERQSPEGKRCGMNGRVHLDGANHPSENSWKPAQQGSCPVRKCARAINNPNSGHELPWGHPKVNDEPKEKERLHNTQRDDREY